MCFCHRSAIIDCSFSVTSDIGNCHVGRSTSLSFIFDFASRGCFRHSIGAAGQWRIYRTMTDTPQCRAGFADLESSNVFGYGSMTPNSIAVWSRDRPEIDRVTDVTHHWKTADAWRWQRHFRRYSYYQHCRLVVSIKTHCKACKQSRPEINRSIFCKATSTSAVR